MKLSKDDLKRLVWHSQAGLTDCDSLAWLEFIDGILNGRYDEPLEIEGYIRADHFAVDNEKVDRWVEVVLGDPKTFPPRNKELILAQRNKILGLYQPLPICFEPKEKNFERLPCFRGEFITHWRLAPNPPAEKE